MKALGNVLVACLLAVVAGTVVFFLVQPSDADAVPPGDAKKKTRIYETRDERPQPSKNGPHPILVCEGKLFEFGMMELGTERTHVFKIRNEGEADLVMKTGTPTCKCTEFELSKPVLKPGEVCEVLLTWKPVNQAQVLSLIHI